MFEFENDNSSLMEILLRDWNTYSDFDDPYKSFRNEYFSTPMGLSETPLHNPPASITGSMSHISPIRGWNLSSDSASFAHRLVSALIYDCVYYPWIRGRYLIISQPSMYDI
jgi:hypothetical protein